MYYLEPTQPYSFARSLKRLRDLPRQVVARAEGPTYLRALEQDGRLGLVRITAPGDDRLAVAIEGDLDPTETLQTVRRAFSLEMDLAAAQQHMDGADPTMAGLLRQYRGARPIGPFSLWESLAWAIIGQQITVAFAYTLKEALVSLGDRAYGGLPAFPGPATVATWQYDDLTARKFTRKKAEYIIDLARAIAEGRLDLEALAALPFEQGVKELVKLRGVGRWTAECLLMDAGAPDAFPAGDIGIRNSVQMVYGLDHQPTEEEVRELGRPWAPYSALACFYLWLALRDMG